MERKIELKNVKREREKKKKLDTYIEHFQIHTSFPHHMKERKYDNYEKEEVE